MHRRWSGGGRRRQYPHPFHPSPSIPHLIRLCNSRRVRPPGHPAPTEQRRGRRLLLSTIRLTSGYRHQAIAAAPCFASNSQTFHLWVIFPHEPAVKPSSLSYVSIECAVRSLADGSVPANMTLATSIAVLLTGSYARGSRLLAAAQAGDVAAVAEV